MMAVPGTPMLTDALWAALAPLLPPRAGKRGRMPSDHRPILDGLFWMMRTGGGWREIPPQFGPWHTVYSRYQQWCRDGTWQRIMAALPPDAHERSTVAVVLTNCLKTQCFPSSFRRKAAVWYLRSTHGAARAA